MNKTATTANDFMNIVVVPLYGFCEKSIEQIASLKLCVATVAKSVVSLFIFSATRFIVSVLNKQYGTRKNTSL